MLSCSGVFFSGTPSRILKAFGEGKFEVCANMDIVAEYEEVCEAETKTSAQRPKPTCFILSQISWTSSKREITSPFAVIQTMTSSSPTLLMPRRSISSAGIATCLISKDSRTSRISQQQIFTQSICQLQKLFKIKSFCSSTI